MARWLVKEEPDHYSLDDLERDRQTVWEGVRNPLARRHLRAMRRGDPVVYYHTGTVRACVGEARVVAEAPESSPDPDVTLGFVRRWPRPVPLSVIRADPRFAGFDLVRIGRLSVVPVSDPHWAALVDLAGLSGG
ncbi:MAG: EVE domain-containing protein [Thermoplasmata archaeon]